MRRPLLSIFAIALAGLSLGACEFPGTPDAAEVNGSEVAQSALVETMNQAASSREFSCLVIQQAPIYGAGVSSTYSAPFAAEQLTLLIQHEILTKALAHLGLSVSAIASDIGAGELVSQFGPPSGSSCTASGAAVLASLPRPFAQLLTSIQTDEAVLAGYLAGVALTTSGLSGYGHAHPAVADESCVSAVLVAKLSTAQYLAKLLAAGANFAQVAKKNSTDPSSAADGGSLGCLYPAELSSPLDTVVEGLAVGQVSAPIKFNSDYVLLKVTARRSGTAAGLAQAVVSGESSQTNAFVGRLYAEAQVSVDSEYGRWVKQSSGYGVVSPTGPTNGLLFNSLAVTPLITG